MEHIVQMTRFLQVLIPLAGAARVIYCLAVLSSDEEAAASYRKRIRNILVFIVLSECAAGLFGMVAGYYGGV